MPKPTSEDWTKGYIEGIDDTIEAFRRGGATPQEVVRVTQVLGISPQGNERLWNKLNQISASVAPQPYLPFRS